MITHRRDYLGNKGERNGKNQEDRIHFLASGATTRLSSSLEVCRMVEFVIAVSSWRRKHEMDPMDSLSFRRVIIHGIALISVWREWPIDLLPSGHGNLWFGDENNTPFLSVVESTVKIPGECGIENRLKNCTSVIMNELISIQSSFFHQRVSPLLTRLLICGRSNEERKHMLPSCEEYRYQSLEEECSIFSLLQSHCDHCHRPSTSSICSHPFLLHP